MNMEGGTGRTTCRKIGRQEKEIRGISVWCCVTSLRTGKFKKLDLIFRTEKSERVWTQEVGTWRPPYTLIDTWKWGRGKRGAFRWRNPTLMTSERVILRCIVMTTFQKRTWTLPSRGSVDLARLAMSTVSPRVVLACNLKVWEISRPE